MKLFRKTKRFLKKLILKLISKIESREFRNLDLDQKDPLKKIIDVQKLEDFFVLSDTGYVQAVELNITQPYDVWFLETSDGFSLDCADNHILFDDNYNEIFVKDLKVGDKIITTKGVSRISYLENTGIPVSMVDLSIDHPNHRYYTNDILSHNTITSSIFLLWYLLFNFEKNAMIMANIGDTAAELMDKIKVIMKGLPFFLKPGILIYNVMTMKFDNGCRIMAKTTTKTSSIGYTIHMLYMDEFAHINPNFINSFFKSVYPTISSSLISRVIITSTPNGMNKFWEIYKGAIDGDNEFNPIRVEWWQVPGRNEEWKKKEIATLGSEEDFNQEYGCFVPGTNVSTINGLCPIEDVKEGDYVLTHSNRYRKVKKTMNRLYEGDLYKITSFGSNIPIFCTPEHPFRITKDGISYQWKEAKYLEKNDFLCFPKKLKRKNKVISEELAIILAWYVTEGDAYNKQISFSLSENEKEEATIIKKCLSKITGSKIYERTRRGSKQIILNDSELVEFFVKNCGSGAINKRIPFDMIAGYEEVFYNHLIMGDGFRVNEKKDTFSTISLNLATDLQLLAISLGYTASITVGEDIGFKIIQERLCKVNKNIQVRIQKEKGSSRRNNLIKNNKLSQHGKIKNIEIDQYSGRVFNLEVEVDNSYVVEGRIVHNCQFLSSSRLLLDSKTLKRLKTNEEAFTFHELSPFELTPLDYSNLIWHPKFDPSSIFEKDNQKFYLVVDTAGGGGGDYSVVNIFKVSPMPASVIKSKKFFEDESDFFCLLQIGIFRSNTIQIDELKVFLETLVVHVLGADNTRIVIEVDYKGEMLMDKLLDCEDFYDEMFVYTKHSEASSKLKPGVKLTVKNKEKYCYDLKVNTRSYKIIPSEKNTVHELTNFGMNNNGSFTSQIGKDDIAMTLVDINCIFDHGDFQETVTDLYDILPEKFKKLIEERLSESSENTLNKQNEISNYTFLNGLLDS